MMRSPLGEDTVGRYKSHRPAVKVKGSRYRTRLKARSPELFRREAIKVLSPPAKTRRQCPPQPRLGKRGLQRHEKVPLGWNASSCWRNFELKRGSS